MTEEAFVFRTTADLLLALPIDDILKESQKAECSSYSKIFLQRAEEAAVANDDQTARAWNLLAHLCLMMLKERDLNAPFHPLFEYTNRRALIPGDMDVESAGAVRQLGLVVKDAELRSRLLDATWVRLRDAGAARKAVRCYVKAANRLFDPEHWTEYTVRVERAARLAQQLRDRELVNDVLKEIEGRVVQMDGNDPLYLSCRFMAIFHDFCHGDPASMRDIAAKGARLAEGRSDFEQAWTWYDLVGRWCRCSGDV